MNQSALRRNGRRMLISQVNTYTSAIPIAVTVRKRTCSVLVVFVLLIVLVSDMALSLFLFC